MAHLYSYISVLCLAGGSSNKSQLSVDKVCAELNAKSTKNRVKLFRLHIHIVFFKVRPSDLSRRSELYDLLFASVMFPASWVIFLLGHRKWNLPLCNSNWPFDRFFPLSMKGQQSFMFPRFLLISRTFYRLVYNIVAAPLLQTRRSNRPLPLKRSLH